MILKKLLTLEVLADEKSGEILVESLKVVTSGDYGQPEHLIDADVLLDNERTREILESMDWSCEIAAACDGISDEDYAEAMEEFKSKLSVAESLIIPMPVAKISKQYYQS